MSATPATKRGRGRPGMSPVERRAVLAQVYFLVEQAIGSGQAKNVSVACRLLMHATSDDTKDGARQMTFPYGDGKKLRFRRATALRDLYNEAKAALRDVWKSETAHDPLDLVQQRLEHLRRINWNSEGKAELRPVVEAFRDAQIKAMHSNLPLDLSEVRSRMDR